MRIFHLLACGGTLAHHGFELGARVGLVLQPYLGLGGAFALWGVVLPGWFVLALIGTESWNGVLAFLAGIALAGALVHYWLWPWEIRRGLPTLTEAEGIPPRLLGRYSALLCAWGVVSLLAIALQSPGGAWGWAFAGLPAVLPFRASAAHHFEWLKGQPPAWWNRSAGA